MKYDGKVVVVTGAGSGMGRAMVSEFVAQGGRVAALGQTLDKIRQTAELAGGPGEVMAIRADVAVEANVSPRLMRYRTLGTYRPALQQFRCAG